MSDLPSWARAVSTHTDGDTTIVAIGGVEVHVRVRDDRRLYVWVELDDTEAPLLNRFTGLLPIKIGVGDSIVWETDPAGHWIPAAEPDPDTDPPRRDR